jgi:hypothetical protein
MRSALQRFCLVLLVALDAGPIATGCGGDDCGSKNVSVQVRVDGRPPAECGSWVLEVRACASSGGCEGACGACVDGAPDPACDAIDACEENVLQLPPGDTRVCVHVELVNGGLAYDACSDVTIPSGGDADPVTVEVDTDDAFPCIRDWTFNGSLCCHEMFGCVAPD